MKRIVLGGLLLIALVVAGSSARAVHGYFTGTAEIMFSGYPGPTGWNLDPFSRVPYRSQGCRVLFFEPPLVHLPNNLTVDLLAASFGPMPGSYHGPYPSREEAAQLLREAPVVFSRLAGNEWPAGADCATVRAALQPDDGPPAGFASMRCTLFENETLITGDAHEARLFDRKTGKRYALYMLSARDP